MTNDTIKEYYVKLEGLWNNVTNILTAINQSLNTNASEVNVQILDTDDASGIVRIPSFLYLENKLETLSSNFSNLFNMPQSGEAWFNSNSDNNMFKLEMVRSNTAPISPNINTSNLVASLTDNNFLKDLVSPKTFLKVDVKDIPDNINKMVVKKYIIYNYNTFSNIKSNNPSTYDEFNSLIYTLKKGIDYDDYESVIDMPVKKDVYKSAFKIVNIPDSENNPWIDNTNSNNSKYSYKIELDTLKYISQEDSSIEFSLKIGDKLCLGNQLVIYKVKNINKQNNSVIIEEELGHNTLQTFEENSEMVLTLYNNDYSEYHYINVPLEENPYLCVFFGSLYNNVRSLYSAPLLINLNEIYMTDKSGQFIYDSNGNKLNYIQYYNQECTNIGDLILGLTQSIYPQLSLFNMDQLKILQSEDLLKSYINNSINAGTILQVVPINKHTIDHVKTDEIISLHTQRNEISSKLNSLNNSISTVSNKLISTDFSQEISITYQSLNAQLNEYYNERIVLQKQLISVVENINENIGFAIGKDIKYRIRGIADVKSLETYIKSIDSKIDLVGIDVEYKYKSINREQTQLTVINSNVFTDWNKLITIDKQRLIKFDPIKNTYSLEFENYDNTNNIVKWNQIDIPIISDEDVIIRVRYKYNIGQPFVDIYTPWSDEITVIFPQEYKDNVEIKSIFKENENDVISAKFNNTLINDGYQEHINNSLIVSDEKFFHMPENIYSGFNTAENKLISLKDKLLSLSNEVEKYTKLIEKTINTKYSVYLLYDDNKYIELYNNTINKITIENNTDTTSSFIKKNMQIVIKNTGETTVELYSIFPGNINIPLLLNNDQYYEKTIIDYERVPIFINGNLSYQRMGQWIYFRQNNFWTGEDIYYNDASQQENDYKSLIDNKDKVSFSFVTNNLTGPNKNGQKLLGYRKRNTGSDVIYENRWIGIEFDGSTFRQYSNAITDGGNLLELYKNKTVDFFIYNNDNNKYILRYEDIYVQSQSSGEKHYLDEKTSIIEFLTNTDTTSAFDTNISSVNSFNGAFLYPNLLSENTVLTGGGIYDHTDISVGSSVSIPIEFEYYINNDVTSQEEISFTKSLYFDLKTSLYKSIDHFLLEVTVNKNETSTNNMINNISLYDDTTI